MKWDKVRLNGAPPACIVLLAASPEGHTLDVYSRIAPLGTPATASVQLFMHRRSAATFTPHGAVARIALAATIVSVEHFMPRTSVPNTYSPPSVQLILSPPPTAAMWLKKLSSAGGLLLLLLPVVGTVGRIVFPPPPLLYRREKIRVQIGCRHGLLPAIMTD